VEVVFVTIVINQLIEHRIHTDWTWLVCPAVSLTCFETPEQRWVAQIGFGIIAPIVGLKAMFGTTLYQNFMIIGRRCQDFMIIGRRCQGQLVARACTWSLFLSLIGLAVQGWVHFQADMWDVRNGRVEPHFTHSTIAHLVAAAFMFQMLSLHAALTICLYTRAGLSGLIAHRYRLFWLIVVFVNAIAHHCLFPFFLCGKHFDVSVCDWKVVVNCGGVSQCVHIFCMLMVLWTYSIEEPLIETRMMERASQLVNVVDEPGDQGQPGP